ncbi:FAD-dependent oxidoreductase [Oceanirhabdus sp. W0125-5]|uniref:FAD-dependent oxidoreductase n=1 Tax=Oceanirhabdus sp. W0125-5 TaxID=2999116 RepID=UPI0022F30C9F|nr:FAD-dependent oxidoreductase [Oceanirhabdus sp. W0125-5]WBW97349.1 FAD-dependent oxidoreductase [Oceanirhabdus sp. W0125-5]
MKSVEIRNNIYWVGSLDPDLRVFDIIMYTPFGTTYNSYVVKGSEKTALFETVKEKTFDQYMERLNHLGISMDSIDYIIVDHTEPDHAGSVARILELAPNAKVVGSKTAIQFLRNIVNKSFPYIEVKDGDSLSLGDKTLKFINAPFLHWPDSIYTYIEEDNMLMTCDSFGSHYCSEGIFNDKIENEENYMEALEYYFNMIMGPFKKYVLTAIEKIKPLDIDVICPGHGPILRDNPRKIVDIYKKWSEGYAVENIIPKITLCYVSAYGYTEEMAKKIAEGIKSVGEFDISLYDVIHHDINDILSRINISDGLLFGTPTINGDALKPIWDILINLNPLVHGGKVAGAFGSFGWSGEGVPNVMERLKQVRLNLAGSLRSTFKPNTEEIQDAYVYGINFAKKVKESIQPKDGSKITKRWRCIVCNEVFDGDTPPETCPACGATAEQFVEVHIEKIQFISDMEEELVIVGNGAAGFYAADAARKRNPKCNITIITGENSISYYRPLLSDGLVEDLNEDVFYLQNEDWYKENNITLMLNSIVSNINSDSKELTINNDSIIKYDKLILANGSRNFVPPIKGIDKKGVYTLKDLKDLNEIKTDLQDVKNVFIIGGGLTGLESAWELKQSGYNVSIAELSSKLLCKQLDQDSSNLLKDAVIKNEINLYMENSVTDILGEDKVTSVKLQSGDEIPAELIIFSVGIRSNIEITHESNIEINRGILVNSRMETSIKDIYACGDVAEFDGVVYGNWPAAIEMGKTAGANAIGDNLNFEDFISSTAFSAMNVEIFSCGIVFGDDLEELNRIDKINNTLKKLFFREGKLVGGILFGDVSKSVPLSQGIENNISLEKALSLNIL